MRLVAGRARWFFRGGPLRGAPARDSFTPLWRAGGAPRRPPPPPSHRRPQRRTPPGRGRRRVGVSPSAPLAPGGARAVASGNGGWRSAPPCAPHLTGGRPAPPTRERDVPVRRFPLVGVRARAGARGGKEERKRQKKKEEKHNSTGRVAHQATTPPPPSHTSNTSPSPPPSPTPPTPPRLPHPPPSDHTTAYPSALTISIHCRSPSASVSGSAATSRTTA